MIYLDPDFKNSKRRLLWEQPQIAVSCGDNGYEIFVVNEAIMIALCEKRIEYGLNISCLCDQKYVDSINLFNAGRKRRKEGRVFVLFLLIDVQNTSSPCIFIHTLVWLIPRTLLFPIPTCALPSPMFPLFTSMSHVSYCFFLPSTLLFSLSELPF